MTAPDTGTHASVSINVGEDAGDGLTGPRQIKASTDLLNWQTLTTITNTTVGFQFIDTAAAGMGCRFYRVEGE